MGVGGGKGELDAAALRGNHSSSPQLLCPSVDHHNLISSG